LFGGAVDFAAPGCEGNIANSWRQRPEYRLKIFHRLIRATNHQAIATFQAHHATACADINIADLLCCKHLGPADVIHIIGVATVNEDITGLEKRQNVDKQLLNMRLRNHHPDRTRLVQLAHHFRERSSANGLIP
jgi:hypothetical protein